MMSHSFKQKMIMKKFFFLAAALTGLLAVSCNKEKEVSVVTPATPGKHVVSIKAAIAPETRTSYADDKTFSWVKNDSIIVATLSADENYIRLETLYAQSSGPETVFTGEVEDGYSLYSLAFYTAAGSYVAFGQDDDNNIYFYLPSFTVIDGDPETQYTVASSNPLANLPLMGVQQDDNSYLFYTATGAAKFTFTDIPEGAAYVAVEMSEEPLSGFFTWDDEGIITNDSAREGTYTYTDSDGQEHTARYSNGYVVYKFDRNADGTGSVYMPLPVGRIPAGATISFYDEELEEKLYSRAIRSDIPIERNKVTEVASFSAAAQEWESIGEGAYYDLLPFYYMNSEVNTFVGVEFFKNAGQPGVYRIENPYPYAAEDRGYTIPDAYKPLPEYVDLTILKDNTVVYDDIHTGYSDEDNPSVYGDWFLACPANWGDDNTYNFVAKYHEDGTPDLVVLSPLYLYEYNNGYYYAYSSTTWKNMWVTVYFPGCDLENQYDLYCTVELTEVADDDPAKPVGKVELDLGESYNGAYLVIAPDKATAEEMIAAGKCVQVDESGTYNAPFPENAPSGEYYAFAKTIPAEGFTENCALLFDAEEEFVYFRSDEDLNYTVDDIAGSYTGNNYYRTSSSGWTSAPVDLTLKIEESDDPLSGYDIMFTDLCPEIAKALAGRGGSATAIPVYASFDTAHGVVVIPAGQPAYTVKPRMGSEYTVSTGDVYGNDVVLYFNTDGSLRNKTNIGMWNGDTLAGNTNRDTTFYPDGKKSNAPARASRRGYGLRPFNAVEVDYSRYMGLDKTATGLIPFEGTFERTFHK